MQETVSIKRKVYPNDYRCILCILNSSQKASHAMKTSKHPEILIIKF